MSFMHNMGAEAQMGQLMQAQHNRLTHDERFETFKAADVEVASSAKQAPKDTMGTTLMSVVFDGGVVLCTDTKTSRGALAFDFAAPKITRLTEHIWVCRSGVASDTSMVADIVRKYVKNLETQLDAPVPVKVAARLVQQIVHFNRLEAGIIVGGWDPENGGQTFSVLTDGSMSQLDYALGGSGSTFMMGWVDANFKKGMTLEECKAFSKRAVEHAKARDGGSGCNTRMTVITKDGAVQEFYTWNESGFRLEYDPAWEELQKSHIPH